MHAMLGNFLFETQLIIFSGVSPPLTTNFPWHDVLVDQSEVIQLTIFLIAACTIWTGARG
jgi:hypothetical protein